METKNTEIYKSLHIREAGYYSSADFFNTHFSPVRRVEYWELEYYADGVGYSVVNDCKYPHIGSHFLLARPGDKRFSIGAFTCVYAHFDCTIPALEHIPAYIPIEQNNRILKLLPFLQPNQFGTFSTLIQILDYLYSHTVVQPQRHEPYMKQVLTTKAYMDEHFAEHITLDALADMVYLSKNFYRSTFARIMEVSPTVYLCRVRITHAIDLLQNTTLSYSDIALRCGFGSQSYMTAVLRRELEQTPSVIRRQSKL